MCYATLKRKKKYTRCAVIFVIESGEFPQKTITEYKNQSSSLILLAKMLETFYVHQWTTEPPLEITASDLLFV